MPTSLDRVQCLLQPDVYAKVRTLAKHNRRSLSAICAELIQEALRLETYEDQLSQASVVVPPKEDARSYSPQTQLRKERVKAAIDGADLNTDRLNKLFKLMELLGDE